MKSFFLLVLMLFTKLSFAQSPQPSLDETLNWLFSKFEIYAKRAGKYEGIANNNIQKIYTDKTSTGELRFVFRCESGFDRLRYKYTYIYPTRINSIYMGYNYIKFLGTNVYMEFNSDDWPLRDDSPVEYIERKDFGIVEMDFSQEENIKARLDKAIQNLLATKKKKKTEQEPF